MWLTKKLIADQIDQKERWYIEQSRSLSKEIEMLHDELERILYDRMTLRLTLPSLSWKKEIQMPSKACDLIGHMA